MTAYRFDLHRTVTDRVIKAIEDQPGQWQRPWQVNAKACRPVNVASGSAYRGVNILNLWIEAQLGGYSSHRWGTYRQWSALGCQVRKGATASFVVFYKAVEPDPSDGKRSDEPIRRSLIAKATPVFNADQVEGTAAPELIQTSTFDPIASAEVFVAGTGAQIVHGGDRACYLPATDQIRLPASSDFVGSPTATSAETYYGTLLHELTHWTGPKHRCDRQLANRFGSDAYAMEELIAELGAAFLCADLGVASTPRLDHAQYLTHWLRVLKTDKRAIFSAASKASEAATYLASLSSSNEQSIGAFARQVPLGRANQTGLDF